MNGETKITASHLDRQAVVYVRQSSLAQVRNHTESTTRQYALTETATRLGWPTTRVAVIDADLGLSGRDAHSRSGLQDLVGQVCVGRVGVILALEVSRLARCSADFARLLELARLSDTLLADADGVYDLRDFNDRLILGLKSTISEAELHLMAGRMLAARNATAERGQLRCRLPVGYVYDDEGTTVMDPDEQVRAAVTDVFAAFAATGSAYRVVAAFRGRPFPQRVFGGAWAGQLRWGHLTHVRVLRMLANPTYAGAYAFGRRGQTRQLQADATVRTITTRRPREQWPVLIADHHPGYLDWRTYLDNQARLAANRTNAGARPAREGPALCQGIITCGSCGQPMWTRYQQRSHPHGSYVCYAITDQQATPTCRSISAATVDDAVTARLLAALTPAEITLTIAAADEVTTRATRSIRAAELAVERARYDADRAERAFHACEPEHRLVARTLESRWDTQLARLAEAETALAETRDRLPPLPDRAALQTLTGDVHALWHAPSTTDRDRKRLLRTLIADITILPEPDPDLARIGIRWHTGAVDQITRGRPRPPRTPPAALDMIRDLATTRTDHQIADALHAAGHRSAQDKPFTATIVGNLRRDHHLPAPPALRSGEITVADAAAILNVSTGTIYYWISRGHLPARRIGQHLAIDWTPITEAHCRTRAASSPHQPSTTTQGRAV
jgi:excisionase family DNA binding protein